MTLDIINNTINSRQFNTFCWYMYVLNESYVQMWLSRKGNDMPASDTLDALFLLIVIKRCRLALMSVQLRFAIQFAVLV